MQPTTTVLVKTLRVVAPAGSDTLATVIGVVGVVLALAALAWQAWSFRQSGSRVRVTLRSGMRDQAGSVITGLVHTTTAQELDMRRQGFTHPVLAVAVNNSGRSPTSIRNVSILFDNGAAYSESGFDPALPFRLDAESEQTWFFDRAQILTYAQAMGEVCSGPNALVIRASASYGGHDEPAVSKNRIDLRPTV